MKQILSTQRNKTPTKINRLAQPPPPSSGKQLTLKQLKDIIEEIYVSKVKFDNKNTMAKLPK